MYTHAHTHIHTRADPVKKRKKKHDLAFSDFLRRQFLTRNKHTNTGQIHTNTNTRARAHRQIKWTNTNRGKHLLQKLFHIKILFGFFIDVFFSCSTWNFHSNQFSFISFRNWPIKHQINSYNCQQFVEIYAFIILHTQKRFTNANIPLKNRDSKKVNNSNYHPNKTKIITAMWGN